MKIHILDEEERRDPIRLHYARLDAPYVPLSSGGSAADPQLDAFQTNAFQNDTFQ